MATMARYKHGVMLCRHGSEWQTIKGWFRIDGARVYVRVDPLSEPPWWAEGAVSLSLPAWACFIAWSPVDVRQGKAKGPLT